MYCPECGNDAGDARFCPECGANLAGVQDALRGKTAGGNETTAGAAAGTPAKRGLSPAVIWGGFAVVAVVVIVIVVMVSGGFGSPDSDDTAATTGGSAGAAPVGVTTGSYDELVQKANELYDKGDTAFQSQDFAGGGEYFQAAAMTYAAAWEKKQSDPGVGTDFATSLFYSGNIEAALKQIDAVVKKFPEYQAAFYNLGNYLAHKARIAEQEGDKQTAKDDMEAAKKAYTKAVALDPESEIGKAADASLQSL